MIMSWILMSLLVARTVRRICHRPTVIISSFIDIKITFSDIIPRNGFLIQPPYTRKLFNKRVIDTQRTSLPLRPYLPPLKAQEIPGILILPLQYLSSLRHRILRAAFFAAYGGDLRY